MTYIVLGVYLAIIFGISWWYARHGTDEDFLIAGRNRPTWQILFSKTAAAIGTGFFLIYTGYAYQFGWPIVLLLLFQLISAVVFAYWVVPKVYLYAREHQFLTMGDYVGHHFKSIKTGAFLDFITAGVSFIWIVGSLIGGVKITATLLSLSYEKALVLTILLVGSYILMSGYRVVLATDIIQFVVILSLLVIVFFTLYTSVDPNVVNSVQTDSLSITLIIGIAIFGFFTIFGAADRYQLIYSAKSENAAKWGLLGAAIPFTLAFLPLVFIGLFMRSVAGGLDPDTVFLTFITQYTSPEMMSLAGVMLVAGLMSTADTWVYATASHFERARLMWLGQSTKISVSKLRVTIFLTLLLMTGFAFVFRELIAIAIVGAAVLIAISMPMLYVISNGRYQIRFISTAIISLLSALAGSIIIGPVPESILVPIVVGGASLLIPINWLHRLKF